MNIKAVILSMSLAGFSIKNSLVIFYTTGITVPVDEKKTRPDVKGGKIRLANIEKTKQVIERENIRPVNVEGLANAKRLADVESLVNAEGLADAEELADTK